MDRRGIFQSEFIYGNKLWYGEMSNLFRVWNTVLASEKYFSIQIILVKIFFHAVIWLLVFQFCLPCTAENSPSFWFLLPFFFFNLSYLFHMIESAVIQLLFILPRLISSSLFPCHLFPFQFVMLILSLWTCSDFLSSDYHVQRGLMVVFFCS